MRSSWSTLNPNWPQFRPHFVALQRTQNVLQPHDLQQFAGLLLVPLPGCADDGNVERSVRGEGHSGGFVDCEQYGARIRAVLYDCVVASRIYNRLIWGSDCENYASFDRRALQSTDDAWMLDAGCGSLVFFRGGLRDLPGSCCWITRLRCCGALEGGTRSKQRYMAI